MHMERALFVVGNRNAGKSSTIYHMFADWRLGRGGIAPKKLTNNYRAILSNERWLTIRHSSPQEDRDRIKSDADYIDETWQARHSPYQHAGQSWGKRWNYVSAMQIDPRNNKRTVSGAVDLIDKFIGKHDPERVRVVILEWEWDKAKSKPIQLSTQTSRVLRNGLAAINYPVEIVAIDAANQQQNGLMLADFFDFT